jgi:hypothetical protein
LVLVEQLQLLVDIAFTRSLWQKLELHLTQVAQAT